MRVLITGGAGFIGRHLASQLLKEGHEVTTLDIRAQAVEVHRHILGSVLDRELLEGATRGVDAVFHLAAVTSPPEFEDLRGEGFSVNVLGTYNVLAACALNGVRRAVIASSSAVYGSLGRPASEGDLPGSYSNFYPLTKLFNEMTARAFLSYGVEAVSLRYFNVYGPDEHTKGNTASVVWRFITDALSGRPPVIYGDGSQRRDFIYVEDAVRATVLAMERGRAGEAYNVGSGSSISFNELFRIVKEETGYAGEPRYVPNPLRSYQSFTQADLTKSRRELGFEPIYDIRSGVRETVRQLRLKSGL